MFEQLYSHPVILRRHLEGPLSFERRIYLTRLASQGTPQGTLLKKARYSLCIAKELQKWQSHHIFTPEEIESLAVSWAANRVSSGRAQDSYWPRKHFQYIAIEFLTTLKRVKSADLIKSCRYQNIIHDFIKTQSQDNKWSRVTCKNGEWQIRQFLTYLEKQSIDLASVTAEHIDEYLQKSALKWSRVSIATAVHRLRAWFRHCEKKGWVRSGLSATIFSPRIYRHEGLPLGPTWEEISCIIELATGNTPAQLRNRAILLLLSLYGLRSGEVRRLRIDDIDWQKEQIHIIRSKSKQYGIYPLEPSVGNAIVRYLQKARPSTNTRILFLTLHAPFRPLSQGGLYYIVAHYISKVCSREKGFGPHSLRHACARHMVESGLSFKEIGDCLGHRNPETTQLYAKIHLSSLRLVANEDLGGLL